MLIWVGGMKLMASGDQRAQQADDPNKPHAYVAAGYLERANLVGLGIAQTDGRHIHHQIHDEVDDRRHLTENLIGRLYRWQDGQGEAKNGDESALKQQDRNGNAMGIRLLQGMRKIAGFTHSQEAG